MSASFVAAVVFSFSAGLDDQSIERPSVASPLVGGLAPGTSSDATHDRETTQPPKSNEIERFELTNGLRVAIQLVPPADKIALVVLFDVGEDDDAAGKSGLGHFVEHVYISASAGKVPQRSVEELIQRYGPHWNAQTGADYTVFATAFAKDKLEDELAEAAARMGELNITQSDLDRERPRILEELDNMFSGMPRIAIANWAREAVRPTLNGGRRGGLPAHIAAIDLETVRDHWKKFYKPINARLILCGSLDVEEATKLIRKHFDKLPSGERPPPRSKREVGPIARDVKSYTVKPKVPGPARYACIAFPAPAPDSELYSAFLLLVSRLWMRSNNAGFECRVQFIPLDDPVFIALVAPVDESTKPEDTLAKLDAFLKDVIKVPLSPFEIEFAKKNFATLLGTAPLTNEVVAGNLYGAAFGLGRRDQMKIDSKQLEQDLSEVTNEKLETANEKLINGNRRASLMIEPTKN